MTTWNVAKVSWMTTTILICICIALVKCTKRSWTWRSTVCLVQMFLVKKLKSSIGDVDRELLQYAC